jgi:hypothetical protein
MEEAFRFVQLPHVDLVTLSRGPFKHLSERLRDLDHKPDQSPHSRIGLRAAGLSGFEDAGEWSLVRRQELDPNEPSAIVKVEDDAVVGVLCTRWGNRLGQGGGGVLVGA